MKPWKVYLIAYLSYIAFFLPAILAVTGVGQ